MFQNCHEVATNVGVNTGHTIWGLLMLHIYAPCSMLGFGVWETLTVQHSKKSLCNNIHEYFDRPWVSSFSLSLALFPIRRLLRFTSDMHAPKFR